MNKMKVSNKRNTYRTKFINAAVFATQPEDGILYMMPHRNTAVHKCMCGCGRIIITNINHHLNSSDPQHVSWAFDGENASIKSRALCFVSDDTPCARYDLIGGFVKWYSN